MAAYVVPYGFLRTSLLACSFLRISFGCLSSRAHFLVFPSNVSARVLISDAAADTNTDTDTDTDTDAATGRDTNTNTDTRYALL